MFYRQLLTCLTMICALGATSLCLAKNINLYDQPQANAKVIGTIDPAQGLIPIISSKTQDWMKVGDPHNGNVGWIKSSDLSNASGVTFSQQMINTGNGPQTYILQYGIPLGVTPAQVQEYAKKIQAQQDAIQKNMQQLFQNLNKEESKLWNNFPIVVPVVAMPQPNAQTSSPSNNK